MAIREKIVAEVREIGLVSLYFLAFFSFFLLLKQLLLEEYGITFKAGSTAVIGALVVAKVVVILDKTSFGNLLRDRFLFAHVLWRSFAYTGAVFVVTLAEHLFELYREHGGLEIAARDLWASQDFHHLLAMNLCVGLSFVVYNTLSELDRRIGEGGLRRFFFHSSASDGASGPSPPSGAA